MHSSQDEREALANFAARYALPRADVVQKIERRVLGAVWGGNGFTTVAQADALAARLDLRPGKRLMDLGTGRGWPGLYLATHTGFEVEPGPSSPRAEIHQAFPRSEVKSLGKGIGLGNRRKTIDSPHGSHHPALHLLHDRGRRQRVSCCEVSQRLSLVLTRLHSHFSIQGAHHQPDS